MAYRRKVTHLTLTSALVLIACGGVAGALGPAQAATARQHASHPAAPDRVESKSNIPDEARRFSAQEDETAIVSGFPDVRFFSTSERDFSRALSLTNGTSSGPWLALSAGGVDGAFGAGLLSGWSTRGTRPDFAVVTGVSAGALIAPYAFLGARYDDQLRTALTTITDADVFEDGRTPASLLDTWPLRQLLEKRITPQLLADVAAEHRRGRRLFVATANLDAGRTTVWNMGAIATRGDDAALKLFRDVLLASASLPGIFPPVYFDVEIEWASFQGNACRRRHRWTVLRRAGILADWHR